MDRVVDLAADEADVVERARVHRHQVRVGHSPGVPAARQPGQALDAVDQGAEALAEGVGAPGAGADQGVMDAYVGVIVAKSGGENVRHDVPRPLCKNASGLSFMLRCIY